MTQKTSYTGPKIALYQPDIPQNTAAIIRTCSCLGVRLEIIEPCGFFLTDPRFKRVVMDYMDLSSIKFYKSYKDFNKAKWSSLSFKHGTISKFSPPDSKKLSFP